MAAATTKAEEVAATAAHEDLGAGPDAEEMAAAVAKAEEMATAAAQESKAWRQN